IVFSASFQISRLPVTPSPSRGIGSRQKTLRRFLPRWCAHRRRVWSGSCSDLYRGDPGHGGWRQARPAACVASFVGPAEGRGVGWGSRGGVLLYSNADFGMGMEVQISNGLRAALDGAVAVQPASQFGPFPAKPMYMSRDGYLRYVTFQEKQVWIDPPANEPVASGARIKPAALMPAVSQSGVVRLFVPVSLKDASNPSGAFEVFYAFRPMERRLAQVQRTVWAIAPSGFFDCCFGMVALMQVTTRTSHRHDESLRAAHLGTYRALASAVDARDSHTGDHSSRVA